MVIRGSRSDDGEQRVVCNSDEFVTSQVTVATTFTLIAAANPNRKFLQLSNLTAAVLFVGGTVGVTIANGHSIPASTGQLTLQGAVSTSAVYGIVAASTNTVTVLEF